MAKKTFVKNTGSKRDTARQKVQVSRIQKDQKRLHNRELHKNMALGLPHKKFNQQLALPDLDHIRDKMVTALDRKNNKKAARIEKLKAKAQSTPQLQLGQQDVSSYELTYQQAQQQHDAFGCDKQENNVNLNQAKFKRELKKLISEADIILEVLDARDPMGCRSKELEAEIQGEQKKIILILNKIDLVPLEVSAAWQEYLRGELPCIMFRANQQKQQKQLKKTDLHQSSVSGNTELVQNMLDNSKGSLGVEQVVQLVKNYSKKEGTKQAVTVGVVGYPNVGKSSLINSLKMSKACQISSNAGQTKQLQTVCLDNKVTLIDSPGVIFNVLLDEKQKVLRNIIKLDQVLDVEGAVQAILDRVADKEQFITLYNIPVFDNHKQFLIAVAQARGKIKQKGIADLEAAGRIVLLDWMSGKIRYSTRPPNNQPTMELE